MNVNLEILPPMTKLNVPTGTVVGKYRFTLTPSQGDPIVIESNDLSVTMNDVPRDNYGTSVALLDADGNVLSAFTGRNVSAVEFVMQIDVPAGLTVTLT